MAAAVRHQIAVTDVAPTGIHLTAADTGPQGVRAVAVEGECFGKRIIWYAEAQEVTAVVSTDPATGQPMLSLTYGNGSVSEHRGYEADNSTWWRYPGESDPDSYREHCMRIVRTL